MAIPLLAIAGAGSALRGIAGIGQGFAQSRSLKAQAQAALAERDMAMIRSKQIGAVSRETLATTLGNIESIRTARGTSLDSQTGQAIERRTVQDFYRDEAIAVLGELNRASAAGQAANGFKSAARWSVPLAVMGAAGDFGQAAGYGKQWLDGRKG